MSITDCHNCGQDLDTYTAMEEGATPEAGDYGICGYCGNIAVYTGDGLTRRAPTVAERLRAEVSPQCVQARRVIEMARPPQLTARWL